MEKVQAQDPLGATSPVVDVANLKQWCDTVVPTYELTEENVSTKRESPFPCYRDLNEKIVLWSGDITQLNAEAIVNSTNESLSDRSAMTERIYSKAGPQLRQEIKLNIKTCKTGEAKLTKGYRLPARFIIHTVGPRYNIRYKTAAESALHNSYRSVMEIVRENNMASVALQCVHSARRQYPSYEGAHIAIRTVRRFLERYPNVIERVIFVVTGEDEEVYLALLPLYFPRNQEEETFGASHLPFDIGNEFGEPVVAERQIRITGKPNKEFARPIALAEGPLDFEQSVNINEVFNTTVAVGAHAFSKMEGDIDTKRKQKMHGKLIAQTDLAEQQKRYERWLKRAKQEDLSSIDRMRCIYQSGFDKYNCPVVVFIGKYFIAKNANLEKAAMYFIQLMDSIVAQSYVVVYLHTETPRENQPDVNFIKDIFNLVDYRYKKNLKALYILHPTFWTKVMTWFTTTFQLAGIKDKVHHIPGLEFLYSRIPADQLDLPDFILNYDIRVNGTRYYTPEEDEAIGSL